MAHHHHHHHHHHDGHAAAVGNPAPSTSAPKAAGPAKEEKEVAERQKELREIAGSDVTYEFDWASFNTPESLNFLDNCSCFRVSMAFRTIAAPQGVQDPIAKEALKRVKTVAVKNVPSGASVKLENGNRLLVHGHYHVGIGQAPSDSDIRSVLLEGLCIPFLQQSARVQTQLVERTKICRDLLGGASALELVPDLPTFDTATALEFFDNVGLFRLEMALRGLSVDPTAKNLLRDNLKKAVFHNIKSDAETKFQYSNGVYECWQVYDRAVPGAGSARMISNLELEELFRGKLQITESIYKKKLVETTLPERTKELAELLGASISYDVDWAGFQTEEDYNFLDNCSCHRINMALRCIDSAVKTALQKLPLRTVKLACVRTEAEKKLSLDKAAGVLRLTCAFGKGLAGCFSDNEIQTELATVKK